MKDTEWSAAAIFDCPSPMSEDSDRGEILCEDEGQSGSEASKLGRAPESGNATSDGKDET